MCTSSLRYIHQYLRGAFHWHWQWRCCLNHRGRVTHICVSKLIIIGSDNGLSPDRRQAITWTNEGVLLIGPLGTNFSETLFVINKFSFKKMHLKISSGKWRPSCLGPNVLTTQCQWSNPEQSTTNYEQPCGFFLGCIVRNFLCCDWVCGWVGGCVGRWVGWGWGWVGFKNAYELLNLRALKISMLYKSNIFQCMGKIFCVEFQRVHLKFHTKYHTHTIKDVNFIYRWQFKSS